ADGKDQTTTAADGRGPSIRRRSREGASRDQQRQGHRLESRQGEVLMIVVRKITVITCCVFATAAALLPSTAAAEYAIKPGSVGIEALNSSGQPDTRAGSHPDHLKVNFGLTSTGTGSRALVFEFA